MAFQLNEEIRILTIRSPYAELILQGKEIETRYRMTHYRGLVLIHCGLVGWPWDEVQELSGEEYFEKIIDLYASGKMDQDIDGHVIAIARLVDSRPMNKADEPKAFVKHSMALYSWLLEDITSVIPFKAVGRQGLMLADPKLIGQIKFK